MIKGQSNQNLVAAFKIRNHEWLSGVDAKLGGNDEGPNPHELLESALAACTIITVQMYANRKQWKLESIDVIVHTQSETKEGSHMTLEISFHGELEDEQKQRLLEIATKCPVHKLLIGKIEIETTLI